MVIVMVAFNVVAVDVVIIVAVVNVVENKGEAFRTFSNI